MKRICIHIGIGKTGTSAIQRHLYENRGLLKQSGVLYSEIGLSGEAHHGLVDIFRGVNLDSSRRLLASMLEESARLDLDTVIISSEYFSYAPEALVEVLKDVSIEFDYIPTIVFYFRNQDELMESSYLQKVKVGSDDYFGAFEDFFASTREAFKFDYLLQRWTKYFGSERIVTRYYDQSALIGGNSISDFSAAIGISTCMIRQSGTNESILPEMAEVLVMLDKAGLPQRVRAEVANKLIPLTEGFRPKSRSLVTPALRDQIVEFFAISNQNFANIYIRDDVVKSLFLRQCSSPRQRTPG